MWTLVKFRARAVTGGLITHDAAHKSVGPLDDYSVWRHDDRVRAHHDRGVLDNLLAQVDNLLRDECAIDRRVRYAVHRICADYAETGLCARSIAAEVRVTPQHFSRIFNRASTCTFPQALLAIRLSRAKELLLTDPFLSVKEVSASVGFSSTAAMDRAFKQVLGQAPTKVRGRGVAVRREARPIQRGQARIANDCPPQEDL